jgi:hypothetical protein
MPLLDHPTGNYRFLPGIAPYSCGVISSPGFEIVHAILHSPVPYRDGFGVIERHLTAEGRPKPALCAVELRSPRPFSFDGFARFNEGYSRILEGWGLFVADANPVARTNVAPAVGAPGEPSLYGFSYTRPSTDSDPPTFVVAGAGELPEGVLSPEAIVRNGETSDDAIAEKATFVMGLMQRRLNGLGTDWAQVTAIDIYTMHPIDRLLPEVILGQVGRASVHGVRWFYSRPPIVGIEFEMDVRGVRTDIRLS